MFNKIWRSEYVTFAALFLTILAFVSAAHCQIRRQIVSDALIAGAGAADGWYTYANNDRTGWQTHEINPLARPFMHDKTGVITYFVLEATTKIAVAHLLHRRHPRLEMIERTWAVSDSVFGASWSAMHERAAITKTATASDISSRRIGCRSLGCR